MMRDNETMTARELVVMGLIPSASELLEHPDPAVRLELVHGLGLEMDDANLPLLLKALNDPDGVVRLTAAWALVRLMPELASDPHITAFPEIVPA
ncbi:MAG: HEAT repeat domain-containing protein [Anaerolineae bacterium]|nr:HEAT repeat domain-containing protein [Anaerolineae bacterium]